MTLKLLPSLHETTHSVGLHVYPLEDEHFRTLSYILVLTGCRSLLMGLHP